MQFSVSQALDECAPYLGDAGTTCADSAENLKRLNQVRRLIYDRNKSFAGTMGWAAISVNSETCRCSCSKDGTGAKITLPIEIDSVVGAASSKTNIKFVSRNYLLIPQSGASAMCSFDNDPSILVIHESSAKRPLAINPTCLFNFFISSSDNCDKQDITARIRVGRSTGNQKITLNGLIPVQSTEGAEEILSVIKPVTEGDVSIYEADCKGEVGRELAFWPANMPNPRFTQLVVDGCGSSANCILLYYRKRYVELSSMDDMVDIESINALQFGYDAINRQIAHDRKAYMENIKLMEEALEQVKFAFDVPSSSEEVRPYYTDNHS